MNKKILALLGIGHMMVDLNTGALPALLPFLKNAFGLSYTMTSTLVLVANLSSSLIQPIFGHLSDRSARAWLLPFGVMAATCGMATLGLAPNFAGLLLLIFISGIGIASYHPEAYKTAYLATGEKKATGISLFSVGGNIGYGLGPLAVAFCLTMFGQRGLLLLWLPGLLVGALFLWALPWLSRNNTATAQQQSDATAPAPYALTVVLGIVTLGACVHSGMVTYVPLYFSARGDGAVVVGSLLSLFLISGAVGTLIAGPLSDRIGHKKFLTVSMGVLCPLIIAFLRSSGPASIVILTVIGACLSPMFSVTLVIAQTLMKGRLGATAGLMTGLGIGAGGLGVTALGKVADAWGVETAMHIISILPLLPWSLVLFLPSSPAPQTAPQGSLQMATAEGE
ncbi:MAG TPA: MFS transporter [Methylomirabilota bacterium]|nr:MFS transporter [Methylomirabilota bacterium]